MPRFFVNRNDIDDDSGLVFISGEDMVHIKNVLRYGAGDPLTICDGDGTDYDCVVDGFEKGRITARITDVKPNNTEPPLDVTLLQGIPKSDRMDHIVQKSVELGVKRIVPVINERTVIRFGSKKDRSSKTARWQRISLEAAKQCGRGIIPVVEQPVGFDEAIVISKESALCIIPYEKEQSGSLRSCISNRCDGGISIFIGPEGGFSDKEVETAVRQGFKPVTLGPRILRTDTAGPAVLAILMYELGDMTL